MISAQSGKGKSLPLIQTKLSGAVQHDISRLGGTTSRHREPIPPNSAFRAYYGYNELHGRNITNNDYQPPSFTDDISLDEDELLPFATTADSATQKISHWQVREEEHYLPRILLRLFSVLGECVCA